jgi:hypothetical protein
MAFRGSDRSEVLIDGTDGFECKGVGGFGTIDDDRFPDTEPIFDVVSGPGLDPLVDVGVGVSDE